jgi:plasmid stability protein
LSAITVHDIPEAIYFALKTRAAHHGRSLAAEIVVILEEAVRPQTRLKIGTELKAFGKEACGLDLSPTRDEEPEPVRFE